MIMMLSTFAISSESDFRLEVLVAIMCALLVQAGKSLRKVRMRMTSQVKKNGRTNKQCCLCSASRCTTVQIFKPPFLTLQSVLMSCKLYSQVCQSEALIA